MQRRKRRRRGDAGDPLATSDRDPFRQLASDAEAIVGRHRDALQALENVELPADLKNVIEAELADRLVREIRALCTHEAATPAAEHESPGVIAARAIIDERQRALRLSPNNTDEVTR